MFNKHSRRLKLVCRNIFSKRSSVLLFFFIESDFSVSLKTCVRVFARLQVTVSPDHPRHVVREGGVERLESLPPLHRVLLVPRQGRVGTFRVPVAARQVQHVHLSHAATG